MSKLVGRTIMSRMATVCGCPVRGLPLYVNALAPYPVLFFKTLNDETGIVNLVAWNKVMEKHRREIMIATVLGRKTSARARCTPHNCR